jgi:hypothetical protein
LQLKEDNRTIEFQIIKTLNTMKRKFTILAAAFALLAFLAIPMGMWGQSDYSTDYTGNITLSTAGGSNASTCVINISNNPYDGIKAGTSSKTGAVVITVPAGTKYLHMHAAAWNNTTCSLAVTPTGYSDDIALTANSGIANNSPFTFNGDPSTSDYYKVITFSDALNAETALTFTATGGKRFVIWGVTSEEEGTAAIVATPTFNPASGTEFGNEGLQVSITCETEGVDIYYTLDGSDPDDESNSYSGPISLTETTTIKAIAYDGNDNASYVATATYIYVDPTTPGTENNPYTVAQARAAIDAGTGTQGVYATGIVSEIPTAWNAQYSNITFNMVDEEGDEDFLQAYRCGGDEAAEVAVGDIVVVYGNLTKYNTTYEFGQGCTLVSLTHPTGFVEAPTFNPAGGTYDVAQTVTISCANADATIYYTLDGSEPTDASTQYTTAINVTTTTTIKAIAYVGTDASAVTTATYNIVSLANISDITEVGTAYEVQGTVVATNSRGFVMGDGTGYVYYYKNGAVSQSIGDMVKISGTTGTYGQIIQFTNTATITEATTSNYNGTPAATIITEVPDYTQGYHLSTYLEFEGALTKTSGNYLITLGDAQIQISYPTTGQGNALTALNGKNVHVKGYFAGINSSDKFTVMLESVEEVVSTEPVINANNITLAYDATSGEIEYTITNPVTGTVLNATTDAEWISNIVVGETSITFNVTENEGTEDRTATVTLTYAGAQNKEVTVTQEHFVVDYATLPFEFDGGRADIADTDGLTQEGLDSDYGSSPKLKFNSTDDYVLLHFQGTPGTLTFDIKGNTFSGGTFKVQTSEDGELYTDLATYTELGATQNEEFADLGENVRYIKWIYTNKSSGNVALGNIKLYEEGGGPVAESYDLTIEPFENLEIFTFVDDELTEPMEGAGTIQVTEGVNVMLSVSAESGYVMQSLMVDGVEHVNDITEDLTYTFVMPSHNVTVSATAVEDIPFEPATYTLVTSLDQIESGKTYIIVGFHEDEAFAMGEQRNNNRKGVAISVDGNTATVETAEVHEVVITALETDGFYSIYDGGYLYAASSSGNQLKTKADLDVNGQWEISFDTTAHIVASNSENRNVMQFNYNNNDPALFNCYIEASQSPVYLYVKEETPSTVTQTIALVEGVNWVSFYVETNLDDLKAALVEASPNASTTNSIIIKSQKNGQTLYNGTRWRGALNALDLALMYQITVPESCEITLEGTAVDPAMHPVTIKNGPNWIAFPFSESMTPTDAFGSFPVSGDKIQSKSNGQANYTNRWRGALGTLVPGQGYIYNSAASEDKVFTYPSSPRIK